MSPPLYPPPAFHTCWSIGPVDWLIEVKQRLLPWAVWPLCSPWPRPPISHGTHPMFLDMGGISHPWLPLSRVSGRGGGLVQAALGSFIYITSPNLEADEFAISKDWGPPQRRGYHPALYLQVPLPLCGQRGRRKAGSQSGGLGCPPER